MTPGCDTESHARTVRVPSRERPLLPPHLSRSAGEQNRTQRVGKGGDGNGGLDVATREMMHLRARDASKSNFCMKREAYESATRMAKRG